MEVQACAKLNLTLDVLGKRPDGYHDLRMIMQSIALADAVTLKRREPAGVRVYTNLHFLPGDEKNLAAQAALRYWEALGKEPWGLEITIDKRIPVCAGMAGGSSDAAAVLRALNEMEDACLAPESVAGIGALVGSDVPYCVIGGTALAESRGEVLTPLAPLPPCHIVICKPPFSISTPQLFGRVKVKKIVRRPDTAGVIAALEAGDLTGVARRMYNVFEDVLEPRRLSEINSIKAALIDCGALGASMSGSGPSVFGLFDQKNRAQEALERLKKGYRGVFLCGPAGPR